MSFYFAACPGPIAEHIHLRAGVVTAQYTTIADESLWLDDFSAWARNGGAHTLFDSLNPEGALGVTWSEVVEGYADERDIALTNDDLSRLFHALETAGGDVSDLEPRTRRKQTVGIEHHRVPTRPRHTAAVRTMVSGRRRHHVHNGRPYPAWSRP